MKPRQFKKLIEYVKTLYPDSYTAWEDSEIVLPDMNMWIVNSTIKTPYGYRLISGAEFRRKHNQNIYALLPERIEVYKDTLITYPISEYWCEDTPKYLDYDKALEQLNKLLCDYKKCKVELKKLEIIKEFET